ncbi:MAG: hypothetical protein MR355_03085 [Lachnospiraceae bacterium]|nr:hypothetical protein [Lachnospiraceae bacterium]
MESTFILAELLEKRYMEKNEMPKIPKELKKSVKDYKKANREKVTDFLCALGLEEFLDDFKGATASGNGYVFFEEERDFVDNILERSKENQYKLIRERRYEDLLDDEAIEMYEFVHGMFVRRGFAGDELNRRIEGPYNLLDYPVRLIGRKIGKLKIELDKVETYMFRDRNRHLTSANDNYAWIKYVEKDLNKKFKEYFKLLQCMTTNRKEEIRELSSDSYFSMSERDLELMWQEEELTNIAYSYYWEMPEVVKAIQEEDEILGTPRNIRDRMHWTPREDYTPQEARELRRILKIKNKAYSEAYQRAVTELAAERGCTEEEVKQYKVSELQNLMTSEQLLEMSLNEMKEEQ